MVDPIGPKAQTAEDAKALQKELQQIIKAIVEDPAYVAPPPSKATSFKHIYKIIPLAGGLFTDVANSMTDITTGQGMGQLMHMAGSVPPELIDVGKGLPFVGMASHVFNLGRMGIVWLGAKQTGTPLPFNFTKKAKIAYYVTALTLSILILFFALTNPFVAGALAVAAASLGFIVAITTLAKTYWHRSQEKIELKALRIKVDGLESSLADIKKDLKAREKVLLKAIEEQRLDIINAQAQGIHAQKERYEILHQALEIAASRKRLLEEKPRAKRGRFFDKHLGIPLALVALIGAIIALSNPFLGLAVAGIGTVVGLGIIFTIYAALPFTNWAFQKCKGLYHRLRGIEEKPETTQNITVTPSDDDTIQALPTAATVSDSLQNSSPMTPLFEHVHPEPSIAVPVEELERRKAVHEETQLKQKEEAQNIEDMFSKLDKIHMPTGMLFEDKNKNQDQKQAKTEDEGEGEEEGEKEGDSGKPTVGKH